MVMRAADYLREKQRMCYSMKHCKECPFVANCSSTEKYAPEKAEELADYVVHADQIMVWDEDLINIINEETQPLFIGQKTSKEVAAIIQSRVQIYINEKK